MVEKFVQSIRNRRSFVRQWFFDSTRSDDQMSRCDFGETMCSKLRLVGVCQKAEMSTLAERQIPLIVEENFIVSLAPFFPSNRKEFDFI